MRTFTAMSKWDHEQVVFCYDKKAGLQAIIAIHDTTLGPALGGTRMWPFKTEEEALRDVLRLSRGMTYKAAAAGLNLGGGKAVIIGDPNTDKSEILFRAFGRYVQTLQGRYITAEDVGTTVKDMEYVRMETDHVVGISQALGGSGDPSPVTALGVFVGIRACLEEALNTTSFEGVRVVIQGMGVVGQHLAQRLAEKGAKLYVSDIKAASVKRAVEELDATPVGPNEVYDVEAEVLAPCALGGVINDETLDRLKVKIVAGAANNQLADERRHGEGLKERGILYAPDYVINAGGLINVANELEGYNWEKAHREAEGIHSIVKEILAISGAEDIPTNQASNRLAEKRIQAMGTVRKIYAPPKQGPRSRRRQ